MTPDFAVAAVRFSAAACEHLIGLHEQGVYRDDVEREPWRAEAWHLDAELLGDGAQTIADIVLGVNAAHWQLPTTTLYLELKRYRVGHRHGPHRDDVNGRTLQAAVQLSEPGDYEGGALRVLTGGRWVDAPAERGAVTVFPASTPHQVTEVTAGERWSLIITGVNE